MIGLPLRRSLCLVQNGEVESAAERWDGLPVETGLRAQRLGLLGAAQPQVIPPTSQCNSRLGRLECQTRVYRYILKGKLQLACQFNLLLSITFTCVRYSVCDAAARGADCVVAVRILKMHISRWGVREERGPPAKLGKRLMCRF